MVSESDLSFRGAVWGSRGGQGVGWGLDRRRVRDLGSTGTERQARGGRQPLGGGVTRNGGVSSRGFSFSPTCLFPSANVFYATL